MYFQKTKCLLFGRNNSKCSCPSVTSLLWLMVIICLFPLKNAHAYLDPGTGSYIIQIIIGSALGAGYVLKVYFGRIVKFFTGFGSKKKKENGLKKSK